MQVILLCSCRSCIINRVLISYREKTGTSNPRLDFKNRETVNMNIKILIAAHKQCDFPNAKYIGIL